MKGVSERQKISYSNLMGTHGALEKEKGISACSKDGEECSSVHSRDPWNRVKFFLLYSEGMI